MKTFAALSLLLAILQPASAQVSSNDTGSVPIPFSELGVKATADYKGDAIGITATADGAELRTGFQKLAGTVTSQGLRLSSTEAEGGSLQLTASAVGRVAGTMQALPNKGSVASTNRAVSFTRPGIVEEYSVSADGVRQDFIIAQRPAGAGALSVELALSGATAEAAADGAKLTLAGSRRVLAYSRLNVTDAQGKTLIAALAVLSPTRLTLQVEDTDATYPIRIDPTFSDADWVSLNPGISGANANSVVYSSVVDGNGNLYVGGSFTFIGTVAANRIAKWDGNEWSPLGTGMDSTVYELAVHGSDLYAGGQFTTAGGTSANHIAKWNGSEWSALGTGMNSSVSALAVSGSDLYAGGSFTTAGGMSANGIAKWDGSEWSALGTGISRVNINGTVFALAVSGNDVYAGGVFVTAGGTAVNNIAKWNGSAWSALGTGIGVGVGDRTDVRALAVSGNDLYVGGRFTMAGSIAANNIAKWDGSTWSALGTGVTGDRYVSVDALALSGSDLYVGGSFTTAGGTPAKGIAQWNGYEWSPLGRGMSGSVYSLAVSGSDLYAGGGFSAAGDISANGIAKWNGNSWFVPGAGIDNTVMALAVSGPNLYVGGSFRAAGGKAANRIAKWDGSEWSNLGSGLSFAVNALAVSGGDLYAGGQVLVAGNPLVFYVAKWNGTEWSALGTGVNGTVRTLAVSGSDLYAGGEFTKAGGTSANYIAKWDGSSWSALGTGMNSGVYALAVSGSDLYAGGGFTTAGGKKVNSIAKWNGSSWSALGTGMNGGVIALAVSGSDLYAGGGFNKAGGTSANYIARWDGSMWSALGTGMNNGVHELAVSSSYIYAGGDFTTAGGTSANYIAQWDGIGWSALGTGTNSSVYALAVRDTRQLYVGGLFDNAGMTFSRFIAQVDLPGPTVRFSRSNLLSTATSLTIEGTRFDSSTPGANSIAFTPSGSGTVTAATDTSLTVTNLSGLSLGPLNVVVTTNGQSSGATMQVATVVAPPFAVTGNNVAILSGDSTPSISDLTDFGSAGLLQQGETHRFIIPNLGVVPLNFTAQLAITGAAAGDFEVTEFPLHPVPVGGSSSFQITFAPTQLGLRTATVSIANDSRTPIFTFAISGIGTLTKPLSQTITFAPPPTIYLGQSPFALKAYSTSGAGLNIRLIDGPATISGSTLTLTGTGTVKLEATQTGGGNYAAARPVLRTIVVMANPTVLTLIRLAQTYDGNTKAISTLGGGAASITYKVGSAFGPSPPTNAGSYAVKAVAAGVTKTGTLVIAKAPLYVTPDDKRKFAGKTNPALTHSFSGFRGTDTAAVLTKAPVLKTTATLTSPGGLYPITASGAAALNYSFIYQQGTLVVESFAGSYEALLVDTTFAVAKLSLTVTAPGTAFTAKLHTATETSFLSFKGSINTDTLLGQAKGTATVTKAGVPYVIDFTLTMSGKFFADVSRDGVPLGSAGDGHKLSNANVHYAGVHTAILEPATGGIAPGGAGWATASINTKGILTLKGKLGDGTAFTAALTPDAQTNPDYRLWLQPYLPARTQSFLSGRFTLTPHPTLIDRRYVHSDDMTWMKTGLATDASYRSGFGPVNTVFMLDPWLPPVAAKAPNPAITLLQRLDLNAPNFAVIHSATGSADNNNLPSRLALSPTNTVSVQTPAANPTKWKTLTFKPTDGTFTGSFQLTNGTVSFSGILRQPADSQDTLIGDGHYLLPPVSGTEKTTGEVRFQRP